MARAWARARSRSAGLSTEIRAESITAAQMLKPILVLVTAPVCYVLYRSLGRSFFARRRGHDKPGHDDLDASSRIVSTIHALVVVSTGAATVLMH